MTYIALEIDLSCGTWSDTVGSNTGGVSVTSFLVLFAGGASGVVAISNMGVDLSVAWGDALAVGSLHDK